MHTHTRKGGFLLYFKKNPKTVFIHFLMYFHMRYFFFGGGGWKSEKGEISLKISGSARALCQRWLIDACYTTFFLHTPWGYARLRKSLYLKLHNFFETILRFKLSIYVINMIITVWFEIKGFFSPKILCSTGLTEYICSRFKTTKHKEKNNIKKKN